MTVSELIEKLKELSGDLPIILTGEWEWEATEVEKVFFGYDSDSHFGYAVSNEEDAEPRYIPAVLIK